MPSTNKPSEISSDSDSTFVSIWSKNGVLTIRPAGPGLGERAAMIISAEANPALQNLHGRLKGLVLDLSQVQHMSSFGLGMCIELRNTAHAQKAPAIIFGLSPELSDLFQMMKVDRLYTIARTVKDLASAVAA